jgi:hypothetical protein
MSIGEHEPTCFGQMPFAIFLYMTFTMSSIGIFGQGILIQATGSSDGGSAPRALAARASGEDLSPKVVAGSSGVKALAFAHPASSSASSSSVPASPANVVGTAFAQAPTQMPILTLKFFELQRRARAPNVLLFSEEFKVHNDLLDDRCAFREVGYWKGRMAMVTFSHKLIRGLSDHFSRWPSRPKPALAIPPFQNPKNMCRARAP